MTDLLATDKLMYGQVPLLELTDGTCLIQGGSQLRWIAREYKMYGENDSESAQIDMVVDGC